MIDNDNIEQILWTKVCISGVIWQHTFVIRWRRSCNVLYATSSPNPVNRKVLIQIPTRIKYLSDDDWSSFIYCLFILLTTCNDNLHHIFFGPVYKYPQVHGISRYRAPLLTRQMKKHCTAAYLMMMTGPVHPILVNCRRVKWLSWTCIKTQFVVGLRWKIGVSLEIEPDGLPPFALCISRCFCLTFCFFFLPEVGYNAGVLFCAHFIRMH